MRRPTILKLQTKTLTEPLESLKAKILEVLWGNMKGEPKMPIKDIVLLNIEYKDGAYQCLTQYVFSGGGLLECITEVNI